MYVHWHLRQKRRSAWPFLDFQKAYDRVEWPWLTKVLEVMDSGPRFTRWIKALYSENNRPTRQLILNEGWSEAFGIDRGTAQGCPLSPFLYNVSVEAWLRAMRTDPHWTGLFLSEEVSAKVLAYADDTALGIGNEADLRRAEHWINVFQEASGARVN